MTPERYQQVGRLYHTALELDEDDRAAFLERACAGDDELRREVESLISSHEQATEFIAAPALAVAAGLLANTRRDSLVGQTVAHYRVLSLIGEGGMGEVYLAEDTRLGRRVALKLLPAAFTNNNDRMRRFKQEARAASALNHPNILTVHEIGRADGVDFIATEFIEGETLRASLAKGRLRLAQALDVAAQAAGALAAAHAAGVLHRDIKPENIMLRPDGYVKVLDFGLAKPAAQGPAVESEASTVARVETNPGVVLGTVQYMSPEQARGLPVDARTDVWSLGVVLYEMVASRAPFEGATQSDTIVSILEREPKPLTLHAPAASAELERIVTKALTKDREERYQTVKDMAIDLRRLRRRLEVEAEVERSAQPSQSTSGDGSAAISDDGQQSAAAQTDTQAAARARYPEAGRTTSSVEYVVGEIKRHKRGAALLGATFVLLLGGVGYGFYKLLRQPKPAAAPFQTTKLTRLTATGKAKVVSTSPDGKYVVYAEEDANWQGLWVKQVATGSSVLIVPPADVGYWGLTFSNDSNYVYYVKNEKSGRTFNKLYQVPSLGGASKKLMEQVDSAVTFSPDGRRLAFVRDNLKKEETEIVLANADGRGEETLATRRAPARFESDLATRIAWSPDGKTIACPARNSDVDGSYFNVVGVSVADGSEKSLTSRRWRFVGQVAWLSDGGGLVMTAADETYRQLWHLSYPGGEARRITNDLNRYGDVSLTADSRSLVTVQSNRESNIWVGPREDMGRARQITSGTLDGDRGLGWTPDGRIVYRSIASGSPHLWIMDADGSNRRQLTHEGQENARPTVSTDGRYIFFSSGRSGKTNVWRMDLDGGNPKQLTDGKINAHGHPAPDGRWLAYVSMDQGNATIWRTPIEGGQPARVSDPTANLPVVSPDGKQIVCYYWDEQADPPRGVMVFPSDGGAPTQRFKIPVGGFILRWSADGRAILYIGERLTNIWSQPVAGGEPVQVTDLHGDQIFNFDYSPDSKWLALARGRVTDDVILIEDSR